LFELPPLLLLFSFPSPPTTTLPLFSYLFYYSPAAAAPNKLPLNNHPKRPSKSNVSNKQSKSQHHHGQDEDFF
jgi:hypothetical protein